MCVNKIVFLGDVRHLPKCPFVKEGGDVALTVLYWWLWQSESSNPHCNPFVRASNTIPVSPVMREKQKKQKKKKNIA